MQYNPIFLEFVRELLHKEGGYVNNPNDSGGETNWGITKAVALRHGYDGAMRDMPRSMAIQIYFEMYWLPIQGDLISRLSPSIAQKLGDIAANMGVYPASEFCQRLLNVFNLNGRSYSDLAVDGRIGPRTVDALKKFLEVRARDGELVFIRGLNCLQGQFYINLAERRAKDEAFIYGWLLNRIA